MHWPRVIKLPPLLRQSLPLTVLPVAACFLPFTTYDLLLTSLLLSSFYLLLTATTTSSLIVAVDFIAILNLSSHSASNREA